jgi:hypothetical protein
MRKAGELIREYLREGELAANRSTPIGSGGYGVVYASDVPGNVMKQSHQPDGLFPGIQSSLTDEANLQAIAAEMGMAPKIQGIETFPGGIGNRIEMSDARTNFELHRTNRQFPSGRDAVRVNQQLGALALKGVDLDDRHTGNIMYNKMTGRPLQLDFGKGRKVSGEDQVAALTNATEAGLAAAGLGDVAEIYSATVYDLLAGGQVAEAMDVAKQGFSRLQKL